MFSNWRRLLSSKEIKPVNPKGNQPWIFLGRTDAEAEAPTLWPTDAKSLLIGKDPDAKNDWGQEEKRVTEDEMVGWHHQLNGHEFEPTQRWWRTGDPGVLQSMGSQRLGHNLVTEKQNNTFHFKVLENCSQHSELSNSEFSWASVPVWRTCLHTSPTTPPVFFISPPVENHLIIKMES